MKQAMTAVRFEAFGFDKAEEQLRTAIDNMEKISQDAIHRFAELIVKEVRAAIIANHLLKTQGYLNSVKILEEGKGFAVVGTTKPYAPILEIFGARPHRIEAKKAKALHWVDEVTGEDVFAKFVDHPGIKPQPHWRPVIERLRNKFPEMYVAIAVGVLRK